MERSTKMRWDDERYVRLYTRDTIGWRMLPWQARVLMPLLLRKVDRAGLLELDGHGAGGLALLLDIPLEIVSAGLEALISSGAVTVRDTTLLVPNFLEAQEANASDAQRKRDQRERDRARTRLESISKSQCVTESHKVSQGVTPIRSVPNQPSLAFQEENNAQAEPSPVFDFESVYRLYPKKIGRRKGMQRFKSQITTRLKYDALMRAVGNYIASVSDPQYFKQFDTFMNCWEDFVDYQLPAPTKTRTGMGEVRAPVSETRVEKL